MQAYPSITADEFSEACAALEKRCEDRLNDRARADKEKEERGGMRWAGVKWTGHELKIRTVKLVRVVEVTKGTDDKRKQGNEADEGIGIDLEEVEEIEDEADDVSVVSFLPLLLIELTLCSSNGPSIPEIALLRSNSPLRCLPRIACLSCGSLQTS